MSICKVIAIANQKTSFDIPVVKEYHKSNEEIDILDNYIEELCV